jgi:hypothetical protein
VNGFEKSRKYGDGTERQSMFEPSNNSRVVSG